MISTPKNKIPCQIRRI